jgi:hypothetical protein
MNLEKVLVSVPVEQWRTRQAIVSDWNDGPREGFCALANPEVEFHFSLLGERRNRDDADDRLFRLSEIPIGSVALATKQLREVGLVPELASPVWCPLWRFPTDEARRRADQALHEIEAERKPTAMVILTRDLAEFLGCWRVDWFSALGIPTRQLA